MGTAVSEAAANTMEVITKQRSASIAAELANAGLNLMAEYGNTNDRNHD